MITRAGVTGTREPLQLLQERALEHELLRLYDNAEAMELYVGCCTGADEAALTALIGLTGAWLVGYPGHDGDGKSPYRMSDEAMSWLDAVQERVTYATRNAQIIMRADRLIAVPAHPEDDPRSKRSGTWQTVRLARRAGKPVTYVWPDGRITREGESL